MVFEGCEIRRFNRKIDMCLSLIVFARRPCVEEGESPFLSSLLLFKIIKVRRICVIR
jgi:hypothetical protein